jgi:hypothetical protein
MFQILSLSTLATSMVQLLFLRRFWHLCDVSCSFVLPPYFITPQQSQTIAFTHTIYDKHVLESQSTLNSLHFILLEFSFHKENQTRFLFLLHPVKVLNYLKVSKPPTTLTHDNHCNQCDCSVATTVPNPFSIPILFSS